MRRVDDVLITGELESRPSREPDYAAENRALVALAKELAANPGGVMQKVAELTLELCRAESAGISVLEPGGTGGIFRWHAAAGKFTVNLGGTMPRESSPCGTVVARNRVLLFNEAERFFPALGGVEPRIYENLLAPWEVDGKATGTVWAIGHSPEHRFDAEDARLLSSLAGFAGAAYGLVERARAAEQSRDERLAALNLMEDAVIARREAERASAALRESEAALRDKEERLRLVVESVTDYAIFTTDTEGRIQSWNPGAEGVFGYDTGEATGQHVRIIFTPEDQERGAPEEEMRQAREHGRAADERWHVSKRGARLYVSGVLAPLLDAGGVLTGYAKIARDLTERRELEEALRQAHDELEARVEERTRELQATTAELLIEVKERAQAEGRARSLLRQLVTVQEEERRRIARELHDTLGQQLTGLSLSIDMIKAESGDRDRLREHIGRAQGIFDQLNADVDFLAWELRPAALDQLGLDAALDTFVREWSVHFKVKAAYHGLGLGAPRLAPEVETNLYRILQEALQNVHKHAGATQVSVQLEQRDGRAVLVVEDNGRGYDPDAEVAADSNKGMGVTNMRERAALVGGELEIESSPGAGTTIYVRVPVGGPGGKGEGT